MVISVSSAEIVRHFGRWQDHAASQPVLVTHHGRERVVLISASRYRSLAEGEPGERPAHPDDGLSIERLVEHLSHGFIALDRDMTVTRINAATCAFFNISREALLGRRLSDSVPGIEETLGYVSLARAAASGTASTLEMPSFVYPGRWLQFRTFPLGDGAAALFCDITDEQDARRLADSRIATLAAIAAHAGIGRAKLSVRGTFTYVDPQFAAFTGFEPDGLARAKLTDILATRDRTRAMDAIEAVLEGGGARAIELAVLARSGAEREVRIGLAPLHDPGGVSGAAVVMTDRFDRGV